MKRLLVMLSLCVFAGIGLAAATQRPTPNADPNDGVINRKPRPASGDPDSPQPQTDDGRTPRAAKPVEGTRTTEKQLPDLDWVPESWPPAIERINAAIRQLIAVDGIANPEAQRIKHAEATNRLSAAVSQFPNAESADLFVPLVVRGFVAANPKNRERDAMKGMVDWAASGGQNAQVFLDQELWDIADRYGTFAICEIRHSASGSTPSHRLLGNHPRAMQAFVVAGNGTQRDLGERALFIANKLPMTQPLSAAFVFVDSLDEGEFTKLEIGQELWLRTGFLAPGVVDVSRITQPSTLVLGLAPRSMNSNAQRDMRGRETTAQAVSRVADHIRKLTSARANYLRSLRLDQQRFVDAICDERAFDDPQLAERALADIIRIYKARIVKHRPNPQAVTFKPLPPMSPKTMQTILRSVVLNRLYEQNQLVDGGLSLSGHYDPTKSVPDLRSEEIQSQIGDALRKQQDRDTDVPLVAIIETSSAGNSPIPQQTINVRFENPSFGSRWGFKGHELSDDVLAQIDIALSAFIRTHGWAERASAAQAEFIKTFGESP